jgi:predicted RNA-binding Zn-ribbon protein involved in translation (DUF1610 family)
MEKFVIFNMLNIKPTTILYLMNMNNQNTFVMRLLPSKPVGSTVFSHDNFTQEKRMDPFVVGEGVLDYNCGHCGHMMLRSLQPRQLTQAVYKCPKCGEYNQIEPYVKKH